MEISQVNSSSTYASSIKSGNVENKSHTSTQAMQEEIKKSTEEKSKEDLKKELQSVTEKLNKEMSGLNTSLKFGFNDDIEGLSVSVIDTNTNKVLRKFPSDEAIELYTKMKELVGMIFDKKA